MRPARPVRTALVLGAGLTALLSGGPLAPAPAVAAPAPVRAALTAAPAMSAYEARLLQLVNSRRAHDGIPRVRSSSCAQAYADSGAARMAARASMTHQALSPVLSHCGATRAGENIAWGRPISADQMYLAWMHSAPHRRNVLDARWSYLGVGAVTRGDGSTYGSQVFLRL